MLDEAPLGPPGHGVFDEPWWLDAVAPGAWDAVEVRRGGVLVGRLPYVLGSDGGRPVSVMPPLTQTLGPWIAPSEATKPNARLGHEMRVLDELIAGLPDVDRFEQHFHHSVTNWLPFHWHGYAQTTRYTYVLDDLGDLDRVWATFEPRVRNDVRRASRQLEVRNDLGVEELLRLHRMTFERQRIPMPWSELVVASVVVAATRRGTGRTLFAVDAEGRAHAAVFVVWSPAATYYLLAGSVPELRSSAALSLLLWQAIQDAADVSLTFDFEGSMLRQVERFFRSFGARQRPYSRVTRGALAPIPQEASCH